jgi:hypothetical protein
VLPERDDLTGVLVRGLAVLLRDEHRGCEDRIVVEQPLLDEQAEGERDRITVLLPQVRGLLADLDDAPEEGVLVGRVGAVAFDDVVDPAVLGEVHWLRKRLRGGEIWVLVLLSGVLMDRSLVAVFILAHERIVTPSRSQPPDEELSAY